MDDMIKPAILQLVRFQKNHSKSLNWKLKTKLDETWTQHRPKFSSAVCLNSGSSLVNTLHASETRISFTAIGGDYRGYQDFVCAYCIFSINAGTKRVSCKKALSDIYLRYN